ncbi:MAG: phospho-N-acetylmuramoyl-pentapeptide-transferase [Verrucomicrobiota bacterium JB022]|nr:phospho-N-acetylmuramoyl-pentapeptide-transferase [Verrucomicrobiota bacterium JB022]
MLTELANFQELWGPLRLFNFITFRSVMGAATALFVGMLLAPILIRRLRAFKLAQVFRNAKEVGKLAELHAGKKGTPTMGGLIIFFSVTISTVLWAEWNVFIATALLVYTGLTVIGFLDDYLKITKRSSGGLKGRYKLAGQLVLTAGALALLLSDPVTSGAIRELWLPFLKAPLITTMPLALLFVFAFLVLAGSSNAINLTDGVDGLAIGCTLTVAMAYGLMAYATGNFKYADYLLLRFLPGAGELTVMCAILCAACLAFLWFNAHPASVFMGDTGSLALGGLVGVIALMILQPFTLMIVGGVFVAEALSVIIQVGVFKGSGRKHRFFRMAPIHHHFELGGWAETQVVIRFWILSLICAIAGLATLKLR